MASTGEPRPVWTAGGPHVLPRPACELFSGRTQPSAQCPPLQGQSPGSQAPSPSQQPGLPRGLVLTQHARLFPRVLPTRGTRSRDPQMPSSLGWQCLMVQLLTWRPPHRPSVFPGRACATGQKAERGARGGSWIGAWVLHVPGRTALDSVVATGVWQETNTRQVLWLRRTNPV